MSREENFAVFNPQASEKVTPLMIGTSKPKIYKS